MTICIIHKGTGRGDMVGGITQIVHMGRQAQCYFTRTGVSNRRDQIQSLFHEMGFITQKDLVPEISALVCTDL